MDVDDSQDVLIVGAGPGGLVSALLLAHSGVKVTMLEKSSLSAVALKS
jgi:phytoene desaturase